MLTLSTVVAMISIECPMTSSMPLSGGICNDSLVEGVVSGVESSVDGHQLFGSEVTICDGL